MIQLKAIERISEALKTLGATYCIQLGEHTFTNKPKSVKKMDRFEAYKVAERLKTSSPGEVVRFELIQGTDVTLAQLQSNLCAHASKVFGDGQYTTSKSENAIELVHF